MDNISIDLYLEELESGQSYDFNDWFVVPKICAGVYTVWNDRQLIYVGMSGRALSAAAIQEHRTANGKTKGLATRLKAHGSGRRSGDQFCVYVGDRLVLPTLSSGQIQEIAKGNLSFDSLIKYYIQNNLTFRYIETADDKIAYRLENAIKGGALKAGKPFLNPASAPVL